jgi:tryptophan-rich sensory protein
MLLKMEQPDCHNYHDRAAPLENLSRFRGYRPPENITKYLPNEPFPSQAQGHHGNEPFPSQSSRTSLSRGHKEYPLPSAPPREAAPYSLSDESLERAAPPYDEDVISTLNRDPYEQREKGFHEILSTDSLDKYGSNVGIWLYIVLFGILLLITLTVVLLLNNSNFFGTFNYPSWAPSRYTLSLFWTIAFLVGIFGLWPIAGHREFPLFVFCMMLNVFFILLYMILVYVLGVVSWGTVSLIIAVVFELFVMIYLSRFSLKAGLLQIPYLLVILLLFAISFQVLFS